MEILTLPEQISRHLAETATKTAIADRQTAITYRDLDLESANLARDLTEQHAINRGARIGILVRPGAAWAAAVLACWRTRAIAVPLSLNHPAAEWEYVLTDSGCSLLVAENIFRERLGSQITIAVFFYEALSTDNPVLKQDLALHNPLKQNNSNAFPDPADDALIIYTSGSTGKPKGAVITHAQITAQIKSLVSAWEWSGTDHIVNVLPLHHIHGIVNVYFCALWSGARITEVSEMGSFDAQALWSAFDRFHPSLFMAVPTIYHRLADAFTATDTSRQKTWTSSCLSFRLMVSGSAALSPDLLRKWQQISGHVLLERYGMTETGMTLSNLLHGSRRPGWVGRSLPGVRCRIVDEQGMLSGEGVTGELQVNSPGVFRGYWNRPEATAASFDGIWFKTGDMAECDPSGDYRILGRLSVDIIKTGGYKVSAPEIEETLRQHPAIVDCAIVGPEDVRWGQQVAVALVLREGQELSLEELRAWGKERLAPYKLPARMLRLDELPRNAMGKVVKPELLKLFGEGAE